LTTALALSGSRRNAVPRVFDISEDATTFWSPRISASKPLSYLRGTVFRHFACQRVVHFRAPKEVVTTRGPMREPRRT
jgi:hypothetical protein